MTDDAENMGLMPLLIDGVAHGFAVDGQAFVFWSVGLVPALQGSIQMERVDPDQDVPDDGLTGDEVTVLFVAAAETLPGPLAETLGPIGDRLVSAHATQGGPCGNGQNRGQAVASALVLDQIARRDGLEVTSADLDAELERYAERAGLTPAAVRGRLEQEDGLMRMQMGLRREKAVTAVLGHVQIVA